MLFNDTASCFRVKSILWKLFFSKPKKYDFTDELKNLPKNIIFFNPQNAKEFKEEDFNDQNILYDEKNQFGIIFAKILPKYRKLVTYSVPSRILIN